ncbi:MAG: hypothetical protein H7339_05490 [Arcicella sp.]|nr:hypothetical protein [Arcicella sp.]
MRIFIEKILPKILSYSEKLDKLTILIDEPWVVNDDSQKFTKFIFRKDNSLLISDNGSVTLGKWDLLNKANSILLEFNNSLKLYNHGFLDEAVLILKIDGGSEYFVLVNQNKIPNLDLENYLESKYVNKQEGINYRTKHSLTPKSRAKINSDKGEIIIEYFSSPDMPSKGDFVLQNGKNAPNGKYKIDSMFFIHVFNGEIEKTSMF